MGITTVRVQNFERPVNLLEIASRQDAGRLQTTPAASSFREMFSAELAQSRNVSFSKHASQRLFSRGIELPDGTLNRIADAIDKAGEKGSRDTLILMDDAALVVAVKSRTVVTAFEREHLREGIVTSIDSAVIL